MIARIGVICQDQTSLGLLRGLRDRLSCEAEFVEAPSPLCRTGREQRLKKRDVTAVWRSFQKRGVDLVVRFTDADANRWQQVCRDERQSFPEEARTIFVCAVAVDNPEDWLCLDPAYLASKLGLSSADLVGRRGRTGRIKRALARSKPAGVGMNEFVAGIVRAA